MREISKIEKPWGLEETWADTPYYKAKFITINEGHRLSRKYHRSRTHTISVLSGSLTIEAGPTVAGGEIKTHNIGPGSTYHLPSGQIHRFCADGETVRVVEVSQAGTEDYIRVEDDYDRITNIPAPLPASPK